MRDTIAVGRVSGGDRGVMRGRVLPLAALCLLVAPHYAGAFETERVIYFVVDGPRDTEFLEDSTHANIPGIWNVLRPQAFISHGLYNNGPTQTMSGHAMIGSGAYQWIASDGTQRPYKPLLWEYLRAQRFLPDSACVLVVGERKLGSVSHSTVEGYGRPDSAIVSGPLATDSATVNAFMDYASQAAPLIAMVCLADVDHMAHNGDWEGYLSALRTADSLAVAMWEWVQTTPPFAGVTGLIVTADHGRHDHDWAEHGCPCHGCRHLPLVALGPDFSAGVETDTLADIWDLSTTMAWVLDLDAPQAEGRYLLEMLDGEAIPPEAPMVHIRAENRAVILWWDPVATDVEGNTEIVTHYRVYRGDRVTFRPEEVSLIAPMVPLPVYIDRDTTVVGNPSLNAFYIVEAVDIWLNPSAPSNLAGEADFTLP